MSLGTRTNGRLSNTGCPIKPLTYCQLDAGQVIQLNGVDQLVYCLERSTSARSEAMLYFSPTSWLPYSSYSFEHPERIITPDPAAVRTLWRYDLYGH